MRKSPSDTVRNIVKEYTKRAEALQTETLDDLEFTRAFEELDAWLRVQIDTFPRSAPERRELICFAWGFAAGTAYGMESALRPMRKALGMKEG